MPVRLTRVPFRLTGVLIRLTRVLFSITSIICHHVSNGLKQCHKVLMRHFEGDPLVRAKSVQWLIFVRSARRRLFHLLRQLLET